MSAMTNINSTTAGLNRQKLSDFFAKKIEYLDF